MRDKIPVRRLLPAVRPPCETQRSILLSTPLGISPAAPAFSRIRADRDIRPCCAPEFSDEIPATSSALRRKKTWRTPLSTPSTQTVTKPTQLSSSDPRQDDRCRRRLILIHLRALTLARRHVHGFEAAADYDTILVALDPRRNLPSPSLRGGKHEIKSHHLRPAPTSRSIING